MKRPHSTFLIVLIAFSLIHMSLGAFALWPFNKTETVKSVDPPLAEMMQNECEPYRQKVIELNQENFAGRVINRPQRHFLKKKHRKCLKQFYRQEYSYLKNTDIQIPSKTSTNGDLPPMTLTSESEAQP